MESNDAKVTIQWDGHNSDLLRGLNSQRQMNKFTDVTIAIQDDNILAHRVVLSACSTYFFSILGRLGDCPHPVIVLREPSPRIMRKLVDYMYTGKMRVNPKDVQEVYRGAESLGIHLVLLNMKPLATSELVCESEGQNPSEEMNIHKRSGSQNGRKSYRPKRLRTSGDSGNISGSNSSTPDGNNTSPDSLLDRSYQSFNPSNESCSTGHNSSHDDVSSHKSACHERIVEEEEIHTKDAPLDFSKSDINPKPASSQNKEKRLSILDSYLRSSTDQSASDPNSSHLAAAQNLAWLSQQQFIGSPKTVSITSDRESDKENRQLSVKPISGGLPTLDMDIAGRLQKAFWAANFGRDNPYGSWMNPGMNTGLAAVAAAAAVASGTPPGSAAITSMLNPENGPPPLQKHGHSPRSISDTARMSEGGESSKRVQTFRKMEDRMSSTHSGTAANGKSSVTCEICGKHLADPSSLYRHRKIHSGEKPHECPYCGRKFIQRYNMTQHIKTHFKERGINSLAAQGFPGFLNNGSSKMRHNEDDGDQSVHDSQEEEDEKEEEEDIEPC